MNITEVRAKAKAFSGLSETAPSSPILGVSGFSAVTHHRIRQSLQEIQATDNKRLKSPGTRKELQGSDMSPFPTLQ